MSNLKDSYIKKKEEVNNVNIGVNTRATGLVIRGYDPAVYFTVGRSLPGRADLGVEYQGEKCLFAGQWKGRAGYFSYPIT